MDKLRYLDLARKVGRPPFDPTKNALRRRHSVDNISVDLRTKIELSNITKARESKEIEFTTLNSEKQTALANKKNAENTLTAFEESIRKKQHLLDLNRCKEDSFVSYQQELLQALEDKQYERHEKEKRDQELFQGLKDQIAREKEIYGKKLYENDTATQPHDQLNDQDPESYLSHNPRRVYEYASQKEDQKWKEYDMKASHSKMHFDRLPLSVSIYKIEELQNKCKEAEEHLTEMSRKRNDANREKRENRDDTQNERLENNFNEADADYKRALEEHSNAFLNLQERELYEKNYEQKKGAFEEAVQAADLRKEAWKLYEETEELQKKYKENRNSMITIKAECDLAEKMFKASQEYKAAIDAIKQANKACQDIDGRFQDVSGELERLKSREEDIQTVLKIKEIEREIEKARTDLNTHLESIQVYNDLQKLHKEALDAKEESLLDANRKELSQTQLQLDQARARMNIFESLSKNAKEDIFKPIEKEQLDKLRPPIDANISSPEISQGGDAQPIEHEVPLIIKEEFQALNNIHEITQKIPNKTDLNKIEQSCYKHIDYVERYYNIYHDHIKINEEMVKSKSDYELDLKKQNIDINKYEECRNILDSSG